jgi:hypothetical protein
MLRAVSGIRYEGWISVEAFDPSPDPDTAARLSIDYLRRNWPGERRTRQKAGDSDLQSPKVHPPVR